MKILFLCNQIVSDLESYLSGYFWLFVLRFWEVVGPTNAILSFYDCRLSCRDTQTLSALTQKKGTFLRSQKVGIQTHLADTLLRNCSPRAPLHPSDLSHLVKRSLILLQALQQ